MTFFEEELKKIMAESAILKDQRYVGRICYGTIGEDLRARIEFVTLGISNQYAGLKASIFNRKEGVVDSVLLRFMDVWGQTKGGQSEFQGGCGTAHLGRRGKNGLVCVPSVKGRLPEAGSRSGEVSVRISGYGNDTVPKLREPADKPVKQAADRKVV